MVIVAGSSAVSVGLFYSATMDGDNPLAGNVDSIKTSLLTGVSSSMRTGNMLVDILMVTIFSSLIGLFFSILPSKSENFYS